MSQMLKSLIDQARELGKTELIISAHGVYPTKQQTKVQDVAVYQNDGTKYIKASHFVERSASQHRYWEGPIFRAVDKWFSGNEAELSAAGRLIARHINEKVDRIKTRRLMHSFRHIIRRI